MKNDPSQEFYREVDQYRHKSGCSSVIMLIIGLAVLVAAIYLFLSYFQVL